MDDGPYWFILLKYGSHDMRHTGFRRLVVVNGTPGFWGITVYEIGCLIKSSNQGVQHLLVYLDQQCLILLIL